MNTLYDRHIKNLAKKMKVDIVEFTPWLGESHARFDYYIDDKGKIEKQIRYYPEGPYPYMTIMHEMGHLVRCEDLIFGAKPNEWAGINAEMKRNILNEEALAWEWAFNNTIHKPLDSWRKFAAEMIRTYHNHVTSLEPDECIIDGFNLKVTKKDIIVPSKTYFDIINHPKLPPIKGINL